MRVPKQMGRLRPRLDDFRKWIIEHGGSPEETTNQYEVLRVRGDNGVHIIYQNAKGDLKWPEVLIGAWKAQGNNGTVWNGFTKTYGRGYKVKKTIAAIIERDGPLCFFCWKEPEEKTVEHLLNLCHGGSNRIHNLVLACKPCNHDAGHLSVIEKVKIRESNAPKDKT